MLIQVFQHLKRPDQIACHAVGNLFHKNILPFVYKKIKINSLLPSDDAIVEFIYE